MLVTPTFVGERQDTRLATPSYTHDSFFLPREEENTLHILTPPLSFSACERTTEWQVVVAISGFYVGLYVVFKGLSAVFSSPKKAEAGEGGTPVGQQGPCLRLMAHATIYFLSYYNLSECWRLLLPGLTGKRSVRVVVYCQAGHCYLPVLQPHEGESACHRSRPSRKDGGVVESVVCPKPELTCLSICLQTSAVYVLPASIQFQGACCTHANPSP